MAGSRTGKNVLIGLLWLAILGGGALAYKYWPFGTPVTSETFDLPFIFWGGDVATFHANGGLETKPDSIFGEQGLHLKLVAGDDFDKQVKNYLDNKSPFLRGTLSMLGQVSDQLTARDDTTPVVFLQLTWSAGDHLVGRDTFKTLNNLRGKKIALQKRGPHVGMLNDVLRTAKLQWKDVQVVWTDDVSGEKGPAELFRKDNSINACFAISPDMTDLTGGLDKTGTGADKTIKGAHVVVSTAHMSRSIADVYACRKDFFEKNKAFVERLTAGYIKGCEELVDHKKKEGPVPDKGVPIRGTYLKIVKLAQDIWDKDPAFKESVAKADDVDGLISDATFVGLPGNVRFFTKQGYLSGFPFKMNQALALPNDPARQPLKDEPKKFLTAGLNYDHLKSLGGLVGKAPPEARFKNVGYGAEDVDAEKTIFSFNIYFASNKSEFDEATYGDDFQRALEQASLFGSSIIAIRGHADSAAVVQGFLDAAREKGLITGEGLTYKLRDGRTLDAQDIKLILKLIDENDLEADFPSGKAALKHAVQSLAKLSKERAAEVRKKVIEYGASHDLVLDPSQMREDGVGVREPVFPFSDLPSERKKNRRVEFRIIKVPGDKVIGDEFEL